MQGKKNLRATADLKTVIEEGSVLVSWLELRRHRRCKYSWVREQMLGDDELLYLRGALIQPQ
jgi:hypothetical protein